MKKLEEFIIKNIWVIIIAVLFGGLPGVVFVFAWDKALFASIDTIKLIIFSFAISFMLFVFSFIFLWINSLIGNKVRGEDMDIKKDIIYVSVIYNFVVMVLGILIKLRNRDLKIIEFLDFYFYLIVALLIIKIVIEGIGVLWRKHKRKSN